MRSYGMLIDGEIREGKRWNYTLHADRWIRDPRGSFSLKRKLETGKVQPEDHLGDIAGRSAWSNAPIHLEAAAAARRAAVAFGRFPLELRHRIVLDVGERIYNHQETLTEIFVAEGHPRRLAEWEVHGMVDGSSKLTTNWWFSQMEQTFEHNGHRLRLIRKPDGVVCVNPPQNAAASNSSLAVQALGSGNALVVKAPQSSPLGVMYFWHELVQPVLERHGAPKGTLNIVSGRTPDILADWVESPDVDDIFFIGDSRVGLKLGEDCVARGKKPILELAGNDGFVVWKDADLDAASDALMECFYGSSQICMVPKNAIVHPAVAADLLALMTTKVARLKPGLPSRSDSVLSPVLKTSGFFELLEDALRGGAVQLSGGRRVTIDGEEAVDGMFIEPTLLRIDGVDAARSLRCVREETFFPLLPVTIVDEGSDDEIFDVIVDAINANEYGLRNSLWCRDESIMEEFVRRVHNGGLLKINDSHVGFVPYLATHGGVGKTGGPFGELNYVGLRTSHLQGICIGTGRFETMI